MKETNESEFEKLLERYRYSDTEVKIERCRISPRVCARILKESNGANRPLSDKKAAKYAVDMIDGRWKQNCDVVRFGRDGKLYDGQHRLRGAVLAGVALETDVVFGLDPAVIDTIDIGESRRADEIAHFQGVLHAQSACAVARILIPYGLRGGAQCLSSHHAPSKTAQVQLVRQDARLGSVVAKFASWQPKFLSRPFASFCYYLFSEEDQAKADSFFAALESGIQLSDDSPVYQLRERLIASASAVQARHKASQIKILRPTEILALTFKAWIAYRDDRTVRVLKWIGIGKNAEPFPELQLVEKAAEAEELVES
jgi:hypothetical protein